MASFKLGALMERVTSTATAGGTTTLLNNSTTYQRFTGTQNQTVQLPDATTMVAGMRFVIQNRSTGTVTVNDGASGLLATLGANMERMFQVYAVGTVAGTWDISSSPLQPQVTTDSSATGTQATLAASSSNYGVVRVTSAVTSLSGIVAGVSGQQMILENQTGSDFTVLDNDTGATAANRIRTGTGASITLKANSAVALTYDATASRWIVVGGTGSGGLSAWQTLAPYLAGNVVTYSKNAYICVTGHTAGATFAADYVLGYWALLNTPADGQNIIGVGSNFEDNTVGGWSLGNVTLTSALPTGVPTFGSGASGNLSIATTGTSPLAGKYSLNYVSSAATTAGNFLASPLLTIDTKLQAKVLTFRFDYSLTIDPGATNRNFSGTSSNSFGVAIYDVTNTKWIIPAGVWNLVQSSGVGTATGTFQTDSNASQYRLVLFNANATGGAITLKLDDFKVGPQVSPTAPAMSDWVGYTPTLASTTGTITNATATAKYRRVGDSMDVYGEIQFSGAGGTFSIPRISLPAGHTIDTTKLSSTQTEQVLGWTTFLDAGLNDYAVGKVEYVNTNTVSLTQQVSGGAATNPNLSGQVTGTSPFTPGSGDKYFFKFSVPVSGWSSNTVMSNDTDTRVVAMTAYRTGAWTATTGGGTTPFDAVSYDTHAAFNTGTYTYTVPVSGYYKLAANVSINSGGVINRMTVSVLQNGGTVGTSTGSTNSQGTSSVLASAQVYAKAGDTFTSTYSQDTGASRTGITGVANTYFYVERLSGPAVVAATESVNARYTNTAGTSFTGGTEANLPFATKDYDSHNAFSVDTYTVPVSGKYRVTALAQVVTASYPATTGISIFLNKNGSRHSRLGYWLSSATASVAPAAGGSATVNCVAGDTLVFRFVSDTTTTLNTTSGNVHMEIERVGN